MPDRGTLLDWRPSAALPTLRRRAELVEGTRAFFKTRGVLEIDTPVVQGGANLDPGITPFRLHSADRPRFLPTSPEHPLKRLVAAGYGAVWTLAPVFRRDELGRTHAPEFRMLEWYRPGWDDTALRGEVLDLLAGLCGGGTTHDVLTYRQAMRTHAGVDPFNADADRLVAVLGAEADAAHGDRQASLDLIFATHVQPHLGHAAWTVVVDWPASLAAQARLRPGDDGEQVAARFEVFRSGVELANGYWELDDADELAARLECERARRDPGLGLAHDACLAAAMQHGLGPCAGVAVGFDRVVMLALGLDSVAATQAFGWDRA